MVFTAPFPRTQISFSVTVVATMLHSDGEMGGQAQERPCDCHHLVTEEKEGVLRDGVVNTTAPFLRTGNPFSVTVAVITLHRG